MNYNEKLRQLRVRRLVANALVTISEAAQQRVREQQLHRLSKSQMRALSASLAQGQTPKDHLKALEHFFGPEGVKKREREGRGWRAKVTEEGTRLDAVFQDINRWVDDAKSFVKHAQVPEAHSEIVAEELVTYYVHVLEAWATLKGE